MNNLKLSIRISILVGVALLTGTATTAYLLGNIRSVARTYDDLLSHEVAQAQQAREMQMTFKKQVQAWKDILLRGRDKADRAKYEDDFTQREAEVTRLGDSLRASLTNAETLAHLDEFLAAHRDLGRKYREGMAVFDRSGGRKTVEVDRMLKGQDRAPADRVDQVVESLNAQVNKSSAEERQSVADTQRFLLLGAIPTFAAITLLTIYVVRTTTRRLQAVVPVLTQFSEGDLTTHLDVDAADEIGQMGEALNRTIDKVGAALQSIAESAEHLASASEEISASAAQPSAGADTQKDQTHPVAPAMQEMSSTVTQMSENSNRAADTAKQASDPARQGGRIVEETLSKMREITSLVGDAAKKAEALEKNSDQIGRIIGVIDNIADQTKLLAWNAAMEAARAAEQGRGVAVVADEVRKLAERTSKATTEIASTATKEIGSMIESIQGDTKIAVDAMEIGTKPLQAGGGESTPATAHSATPQAARTWHDLSILALDLRNIVGQFKLPDGARGSSGPPSEHDSSLSYRRKMHPEKFVRARIHAERKEPLAKPAA